MISSPSETWLRRTVILPAGNAGDALDVLYTTLASLAIIGMLAAATAVLVGIASWATGSPVHGSALWVALPILVFIAWVTSVHWLQLDATGIRLGRRGGKPAFVPWEDVLTIRPATRREVIFDGWIWPPLPPREATRCLSSLGQYRIDYHGGRFYFPPSDPDEFERAVEYWKKVHADQRDGIDQPPA